MNEDIVEQIGAESEDKEKDEDIVEEKKMTTWLIFSMVKKKGISEQEIVDGLMNKCSNCGAINASAYRNYCPNCGAKMQEVEE